MLKLDPTCSNIKTNKGRQTLKQTETDKHMETQTETQGHRERTHRDTDFRYNETQATKATKPKVI